MSSDEDFKEEKTSIFDTKTSSSDLTLEVEGRQLHVNKSVLVMASVVFERMFQGDVKEKTADIVPLPGKCYDDIVEMLLCIYPSELKEITREKIDVLLKLADEYQIAGLKRNCESFLLKLCQLDVGSQSSDTTISTEELVHSVRLAEIYNLETLLEKTIDIASKHTFYPVKLFSNCEPIASVNEYGELSDKTLILFLSKRVHHLENMNKR